MMRQELEERRWSGVQGNLRREAIKYRVAFWIAVTCITVYCWASVIIGITFN